MVFIALSLALELIASLGCARTVALTCVNRKAGRLPELQAMGRTARFTFAGSATEFARMVEAAEA